MSFVGEAGSCSTRAYEKPASATILDETALRSVFVGWRVRSIVSEEIPTDVRMMPAIVARLEHE